MTKDKILDDYGEEYSDIKQYENKSKRLVEAHEACRPCDFTVKDISDDPNMEHNEIKLYKLIWERTVASQMKPCQAEIVTTKKISQSNSKYKFIYKSETILFEGFRILYQQKPIENDDENDSDSDKNKILVYLKIQY